MGSWPARAFACLAVVAVACTGAAPPASTNAPTMVPPTTATTTTHETTTTPPTSSSTVVAPPTTAARPLAGPVASQVDWFVGLLNGAEFDEGDYLTRFAEEFLAQVGPEQFTAITAQLQAGGSAWSVRAVDVAEPDGAVVVLALAAGEPALRLSLSIDAEQRIDGLLVQPADQREFGDPHESAAEAARLLAELGTLGYVVADVTGGRCSPRMGEAPDTPVPLGSVFKLYVLGAVVDAVAAGSITWDQKVEVEDRFRSLPSGIVQRDEAGTMRTVQELAELMISISDNTATDHLIGLVGRPAVEQAQRDYGHANPELNEPFLTTRELFVLKLVDRPDEPGLPGPLGAAYLAADEKERRELLAGDVAGEPIAGLESAFDTTKPIAVATLEWFASPLDVCRALVGLAADPTATEILAVNPGLPDTEDLWSYVGFKGGSEPGVLSMAWYLVDAGGAAVVVAGSVWNEDTAFLEQEAALLFGALRDLAGAG